MDLATAIFLVILHRIDGGDILVNPSQVTSLRAAPGSMRKHLAPLSQCIVGLTDGKFAAVVESCDEVRRLLENTR